MVKRVHAKLVVSFSKWWSVMTYAAVPEVFASWSLHAARSAEWEKVVCRIRCCSHSGKKEMYWMNSWLTARALLDIWRWVWWSDIGFVVKRIGVAVRIRRFASGIVSIAR